MEIVATIILQPLTSTYHK